MIKALYIASLILSFSSVGFGQSELPVSGCVADYKRQPVAGAWRGIVPLKSTREDVERLLGPPTGPLGTYYLPDSTVDFKFSSCKCGEKCKNDDWSVRPDTVILIRVGVKGIVKLTDLNVDLTKFKKWPGDEDVPSSFLYKNDEEGLAIEGGGGFVSALVYVPEAKYDHLRCSHNPS